MGKINALFFDNLGNFQGSSVTALLSVVILILQICQFIYQQIKIKELKTQDISADFRIENLNEMKKSILQYLNLYTNSVFNLKNEIESASANKLLLSLNKNNKKFEKFKEAFLEINTNVMNGEIDKVKLGESMNNLTDAYNEYEQEEIKNIYKLNKGKKEKKSKKKKVEKVKID